jgi:hypothetical protein
VCKKYSFIQSYYISGSYENIEGILCSDDERKFELIFVYRPPDSNIYDYINEFETHLRSYDASSTLIYGGDINIDTESEIPNRSLEEYETVLNSKGLIYLFCLFI